LIICTIIMLAVALSLTEFTKRFVTTGGIYSLIAKAHPIYGIVTAWFSLLGCVVGGVGTPLMFGMFLQALLRDFGIAGGPGMLLCFMIGCTVVAGVLAWRDTTVSTAVVFVVEGISLLAMLSLFAFVIFRHVGSLFDPNQLRLTGVTLHQIVIGTVVGLCAFNGFEYCCSFGLEAKRPRKEITLAVLGSIGMAGTFYVICAYVLILCFRNLPGGVANSANPLSDLAVANGANVLRYVVQVGVIISLFSMFVTSFNVWSRMLLTLSRDRLFPDVLGRVDATTRTPATAIVFCVALDVVLQIAMVMANLATKNIYVPIFSISGLWITSTYVIICVAMVTYLAHIHELRWRHIVLGAVGGIPLTYSLIASTIPMPPFPDNIAVYLFVGGVVLMGGQLMLLMMRRSTVLCRIGSSVDWDTTESPDQLDPEKDACAPE